MHWEHLHKSQTDESCVTIPDPGTEDGSRPGRFYVNTAKYVKYNSFSNSYFRVFQVCEPIQAWCCHIGAPRGLSWSSSSGACCRSSSHLLWQMFSNVTCPGDQNFSCVRFTFPQLNCRVLTCKEINIPPSARFISYFHFSNCHRV